ncbi:hypothetical protein lerEdw1_012374 [Lerista edwardsae]|nr:hypothetical protein lerEdw1_012374 [Lerista edwardsae]
MAPKKDAKGKDAKGKDAKGKDAKGKGPTGERAYRKSREVPDAMADLQARMVKLDNSLEGKSDDEILEAAEAMSQHVIDRRVDISLLKSDIETYKNRIKQGWRIYNRTFWYFTQRAPYKDIKIECVAKGVKLQKIVDTELEKFLETQLERFQSGIWVPMFKKWTSRSRFHWTWEDDNTKATGPMFWQQGEPNHYPHENCAEIKVPCGTPHKCWNDIPCTLRNVGFCRGESVEMKWLSVPEPDQKQRKQIKTI